MSLTRTVAAPSSVTSSIIPNRRKPEPQRQNADQDSAFGQSSAVGQSGAIDPLLGLLRSYLITDPEKENRTDNELLLILENARNSSRGSLNLE